MIEMYCIFVNLFGMGMWNSGKLMWRGEECRLVFALAIVIISLNFIEFSGPIDPKFSLPVLCEGLKVIWALLIQFCSLLKLVFGSTLSDTIVEFCLALELSVFNSYPSELLNLPHLVLEQCCIKSFIKWLFIRVALIGCRFTTYNHCCTMFNPSMHDVLIVSWYTVRRLGLASFWVAKFLPFVTFQPDIMAMGLLPKIIIHLSSFYQCV